MTAPPILVVHLFTTSALEQILGQLKAGKRPPGTKVYLGTYSINDLHAAKISEFSKTAPNQGVFYAPTLHLSLEDTKELRKGRDLPERDAMKVDQALSGEFPAGPKDLLPAKNPHAWGVELGRRFRDQMRVKSRPGHEIKTWQLDEIPRECVLHERAPDLRLFVGGVVRGLAEGRVRLGDKVLPGFVWIAWQALTGFRGRPGLPVTGITGDMKVLWDDLNVGAMALVGEEYPEFKGSAAAVGAKMAGPQKALAAQGTAAGIASRQALAKKYIVGMTPGFHKPFKKGGLTGNVEGLSFDKVTTWRNEFITARSKAQRPIGYGMFHFDGDFNTQADCIKNAITALNSAANKHAKLLAPT